MKSRELTNDEVQENFLKHILSLVDYWNNDSRTPDTKEKLEGLAHSIMATLDGSTHLPAFVVSPLPHPEDKSFNIKEGDNYYPQFPRAKTGEAKVKCDIAGNLAYRLFRVKEKMEAGN